MRTDIILTILGMFPPRARTWSPQCSEQTLQSLSHRESHASLNHHNVASVFSNFPVYLSTNGLLQET